MTTPAPPKNKRIYCNECRHETNHEHVGETADIGEEADEESGQSTFWWEQTYSLWKCLGCGAGTLELAYTDSSLHDEGERIYTRSYYPERLHGQLPVKHFLKLPQSLRSIYRETIDAFNRDLRVLCAGGLRSLIQGVCRDKGIRARNIEKEIDGLRGYLPDNLVTHLHGFRFLGNVALHELQRPERGDLRIAIDVAEDLLNYLYELDYKASRLGRIGARASKPSTAPVKRPASKKGQG